MDSPFRDRRILYSIQRDFNCYIIRELDFYLLGEEDAVLDCGEVFEVFAGAQGYKGGVIACVDVGCFVYDWLS